MIVYNGINVDLFQDESCFCGNSGEISSSNPNFHTIQVRTKDMDIRYCLIHLYNIQDDLHVLE